MSLRIASGGPWEERYGYSRAVAAGNHLWVAGSTSVVDGEVAHAGDPGGQTRTAFGIALAAVEQAGFTVADVVRTRMFVVDLAANGDAVAKVHGELFADVRPASTMVGVAALIDPRLVVEVEVEAYRERT
jgi:enamine deaminase RidA (YjgF/YER057c/UK114 family)